MKKPADVGRITMSRTDSAWGTTATPVRNLDWFECRTYTPDRLSSDHSTDREWYAYDASALMVKGHCEYEPLARALSDEGLTPIKTADGKAIASVWFNRIRDSVCGVYNEIVMSVDTTPIGQENQLDFAATANPFHYLYNIFVPSICQQQFLHSLYIDSPISIAWGREMQGFPKHPIAVDAQLQMTGSHFRAEVNWGEDLIVRAVIGKRWGLLPLFLQAFNLMTIARPSRMAKFLVTNELTLPIQMPRETVRKYNVSAKYLSHIRKSKNPSAIQCWPWAAEDSLDLGDCWKPTNCEDNNAHVLFNDADFTPKIVTYVPFMQAYVGSEG